MEKYLMKREMWSYLVNESLYTIRILMAIQ